MLVKIQKEKRIAPKILCQRGSLPMKKLKQQGNDDAMRINVGKTTNSGLRLINDTQKTQRYCI